MTDGNFRLEDERRAFTQELVPSLSMYTFVAKVQWLTRLDYIPAPKRCKRYLQKTD